MIVKRLSGERGHADHGWLDSYHSFSFADYYDPAHMGYRSLRVINEDVVQPSSGFPLHPHRNMEIITYVISGKLQHHDSMGNGSIIEEGHVQTMSAGTGIRHSEYNASDTEPVHLLQIWIQPERTGLPPRYAEWNPPKDNDTKLLSLLVSPDGRDGSAQIAQDALIWLGKLRAGQKADYPLTTGRGLWVQVFRGSTRINGMKLATGDAAAVEEEKLVTLESDETAEVLLFDLG